MEQRPAKAKRITCGQTSVRRAWSGLRVLCGDLSYLEGPRRASGRCPFPAVSGLGARPDRIGSQGAKEAQEGGSDALGHLGWFIGEVHVGSQESVGSRVLVGRRLGCARWGAVVQRSLWCWHIRYRDVTREICRPSSQNATGMWWNSASTSNTFGERPSDLRRSGLGGLCGPHRVRSVLTSVSARGSGYAASSTCGWASADWSAYALSTAARVRSSESGHRWV